MRKEVLKLNANYLPLAEEDWQKVMVKMASGAVYPMDVYYATDENGNVDLNVVDSCVVIRDFDEWCELPIRPYDDYVNTSKKAIRIPPVVLCASYNKTFFARYQFPTKQNIAKRDKFTCGYTGVKLDKENLTIDHIIPVSRGGENTWENLITCDKKLNVWKADRTPKECGLKLLWQPTKPADGLVFNFLREEWKMFIYKGEFD